MKLNAPVAQGNVVSNQVNGISKKSMPEEQAQYVLPHPAQEIVKPEGVSPGGGLETTMNSTTTCLNHDI